MYSHRRHVTDVFTPRGCLTAFDRDRQDENRRTRFEAARVRRREQEQATFAHECARLRATMRTSAR